MAGSDPTGSGPIQVLRVDVTAPHRRAIKSEHAPALEDPIDNRLAEIRIVQHLAPRIERLVRGEDHRPPLEVALVDDMKEQIRGVRAVREVSHLIDDQHVRVHPLCDRALHLSPAACS
jgi:hypothetical protein